MSLTSPTLAGPDWAGSASLTTSAATLGDPIAEVPLAQVATRDGADGAVGLIRITGRWDPRSAVALHELDGGQERAALIAIREWMVLDEVPAQDGGLRRKVGLGLHVAEAGLRRGQRGVGQPDAIEV
ncbi:MAG: hypothetical protein ACRDGB_08305, partial [Candidatus Limnocylindria bacterium]